MNAFLMLTMSFVALWQLLNRAKTLEILNEHKNSFNNIFEFPVTDTLNVYHRIVVF